MSLALEPLRQTKTILLATYKRDETPAATPVSISIALDDDRAFFRTWHKAHKTKQLRNKPNVRATPSTLKGEPTGSLSVQCTRKAARGSRSAGRGHGRWPGATASCRRSWCHSGTA
jgi:PPOX class probable F420-dependent enzyme